jgi:hypothetical protein
MEPIRSVLVSLFICRIDESFVNVHAVSSWLIYDDRFVLMINIYIYIIYLTAIGF